MKPIKDIPIFERPREKLYANGPEALSDSELLAILIGSGIKGKNVFQIARTILRKLDKEKEKIDVRTLVSIDGVGFAKACQIVAAFEFTRRRLLSKEVVILKTEDVLPLVSHIADKKQEYFLCVSLNGANEVIGNRVVTVGLLNESQVHPREVFVDAISDRAAAIILVHNHPSGILKPSPPDLDITEQLVKASKIIGIPIWDHIIVTKKGYFSFREKGLI